MPNSIDVIRRLANNVYTSPYDKTRDTACLAVFLAFHALYGESEIPESVVNTVSEMPPQEMLKAALAMLETAAEAEEDEGNGGTDGTEGNGGDPVSPIDGAPS